MKCAHVVSSIFICVSTMHIRIVGGPFVAIVGTTYIVWLLGWHAVIGMLTFVLFYPVQYGISTLTGMEDVGSLLNKLRHIV